jgi:hypothetical protein
MSEFSKSLAQKAKAAQAFVRNEQMSTEASLIRATSVEVLPKSSEVQVDVDKVIENILASVPLDSFPVLLRDTLTDYNSSRPSVLLSLFKRFGAVSRTKTYGAQAGEISSIAGMMQAQSVAFQQAFNNARLPELLNRQVQVESATHQSTLVTLAQQAIMAKLAISLNMAAMQEGLSLEVYLSKVDKQVELEHRRTEIDQDIEKDRRLRANAREDEAEKAETEITVSTRASLVFRKQEKALRRELRESYVRRDNICQGIDPETSKTLSESLKADYLKEVNHDIASLEAKIDRFTEVDSEANSEA